MNMKKNISLLVMMTMLLVAAMAMLPSTALAEAAPLAAVGGDPCAPAAAASFNLKVSYGYASPVRVVSGRFASNVDPCAPAEPEPAPVIPQEDPPGAPPPIGYTTENAAGFYENGPAIGYDANGVVAVTGTLSVTGGPFSPPALVHLPIPADFDQDSLMLARWDPVNNLWVPVPGSGPCGDTICGATTTDGVFAVVEAGWFK